MAIGSERDADTGRKLLTLPSPGSAEMREIAWSPDGRRIIAAADDGVLRFWNAVTGAFLASLYVLDESRDWLLVAADGRLDGTDAAFARLVAWRSGDRVAAQPPVTSRYRVRGLWRVLFPTQPP